MPIGVGGAAAIAAGASILSSSGNMYAQGRMNRKTRKWNEAMYDKQRGDALADWAMQNEYNSPQAQMQRYRDAGLNPALIYGQMNDGAIVRSTDTPSWNPRAPQFDHDPGNDLMRYFDIQLREANLDNLRAQQTVLMEEAALKAATTASTAQSTAKSKFELDMAGELKETSLQAAQANLDKTRAETKVVLEQNERAAAVNAYSLKEAAERIIKLRLEQANVRAQTTKNYEEVETIQKQRAELDQRIEQLKKDNQIKKLDIDLKEKGVQPTDNIIFRILGRLLEQNEKTGSSKKWKLPEFYNPNKR